MKNQRLSACLLLLGLFTACAYPPTTFPTRGKLVTVNYARITEMRKVSMPSAAPAGAIIGGFTGLLLSRDESTARQIASGIGGAALGAIATSALEGDRLGYQYTLRYTDGRLLKFTDDKAYLRVNDCVAVEQGRYANIRRIPATFCTGEVTLEADKEHLRMAEQCIEAKNQLLRADDEETIELSRRKISILCQDFDGE